MHGGRPLAKSATAIFLYLLDLTSSYDSPEASFPSIESFSSHSIGWREEQTVWGVKSIKVWTMSEE